MPYFENSFNIWPTVLPSFNTATTYDTADDTDNEEIEIEVVWKCRWNM